jgi:predicted metal-dependent phosphoesterase TrpH
MKIDLHVHTHLSSDAWIPLNKDLVRVLKKRGIQGIAITDHNSFKGVAKAKRLLEKEGLFVIPGEEVKTTENGELLCLFINEEICSPGLKKYRFLEVVDKVKEQDGLVGLSHPLDFSRKNWISKMQIDWINKYIDIIEAYNARCNLHLMNKRAYSFCINHNIPFTAGSDAHFLMEIGRGCLVLDEQEETIEAIRHQIMSGNSCKLWNSNSLPFVNVSSICLHALTGISQAFWPIGRYFST